MSTPVVRNDLSARELEAFVDGQRAELNKTSAGSELRMVQLQTQVQARQQSIQMLTNTLRSLHDSEMGVIQNMKG